ncbi:MAG: tetraacyldisaccharide 4'-kinase [Campylobacterota bacterium]|nr:tetraacyldisaccharide 4'-kinase [Campylobacterota bacterium]
MQNSLKTFFEELLFAPRLHHYPIILALLPVSILYAFLMFLRRILTQKIDFDIPIVSVGNLIMGGSGKTPFIIAVASRYKDVAIISRGYGRESQGLIEVSHKGRVLTDINQSGDEAMLIAQSLKSASVIVSEDRKVAIKRAKELGAKVLFLDDGFNRVEIKKLEILLEPKVVKNYLPLPSGAFREFYFTKVYANLFCKEGQHFRRKVSFENLSSKMLLVSAISNPSRLDEYLPVGIVGRLIYPDHAYFDIEEIKNKMKELNATSILVTQKDWVKLQNFDLPISLMKLDIDIDESIIEAIDHYILDQWSQFH